MPPLADRFYAFFYSSGTTEPPAVRFVARLVFGPRQFQLIPRLDL